MKQRESTFVGRKSYERDGVSHVAEVSIRAWPSKSRTSVEFTREALDDLASAFGDDFECQRHNIQALLYAHMDSANNAIDGLPGIRGTTFESEVLRVRVEGVTSDRKLFGFLLSTAAGAAFGQFFEAWYMSSSSGFGA